MKIVDCGALTAGQQKQIDEITDYVGMLNVSGAYYTGSTTKYGIPVNFTTSSTIQSYAYCTPTKVVLSSYHTAVSCYVTLEYYR